MRARTYAALGQSALLLTCACSQGDMADEGAASVLGGDESRPVNADEGTVPGSSDDRDEELPAPPVSPEQFEAVQVSHDLASDYDVGTTELIDTSGSAWRIIEVPAASNAPHLLYTEDGWFALSRRSLGDAKVPSAWETVLYRSQNGVHWESVPLDPGHDDLALREIAYGNGTYVMIGSRNGANGGAVFWTSKDGEQWKERAQPELDQVQWLTSVAFAGGRFFAFGFRVLAVSEDAEDWTLLASDFIQFGSAAYGNERYVLSGSGPMMVSADGLTFTSYPIDCSYPGGCVTDPDGNTSQTGHGNVMFVDGLFYASQLRSADGVAWESLPGRSPSAYAGERFIGGGEYSLESWTADGDPDALHVIRPARAAVTAEGRASTSIGVLDRSAPLPETVDVEFEDGLDCETASCVIVGSRLYLVPPLGTSPLVDRIPRDAEGAALLSPECPYSGMIACDDYAERRGCACNPEAPAGPVDCQDVSEFQCAGAFEHQGEEWEVSEVGAAGCDCGATDPAEPPTFSDDCAEDATLCAAPLECLTIDVPFSYGPPGPAPLVCTARCDVDADCPTWEATGYCAGSVTLTCSNGSCQPRSCE